jgi:hypothetical protein
MSIDLAQLDRELGLEDDPLDEYDLLEDLAGKLGVDESRRAELEEFIQASGIVIADGYDAAGYGGFRGITPVRKCKDCNEPARPRKSPNGPWPQRCEEHTKARKKHMDAGGSKARPQYRKCCVDWQLDSDPGHRGLCQQCRDARKASRQSVSHTEANPGLSRSLAAEWRA